MMKTILIAVFLQLAQGEDGKLTPQVMAAITAEFESNEACKNAVAGLVHMADATGFKVNALCAPKDIGKLEVEKPKPKAKPSGLLTRL